jgi:tetratricopeptide (TPR) repeat protein
MQFRLAIATFVLCLACTARQQTAIPDPIAAGMQLARQGRYLEAEHILKTYAGQNPNTAAPQAALGQLYYHFGYYAAAEPAFQKAIALDSNDRSSRILGAVCLFKIGEGEAAEAATRTLLAEKPPPDDVDLSLTYAQYLYEKHDLDAALAQAQAAVAFAPQHPIGFFWLARILQAKGDTKQATVAAERSVKLAPQLPYARNLLVRLYRIQGRVDDAERQAQWFKGFEAPRANP